MHKSAGEAWSVIRGTLRDRFSVLEIMNIVRVAIPGAKILSHLPKGARESSKRQLIEALDAYISLMSISERDTFVAGCVNEMTRSSEDATLELKVLHRFGWIMAGGTFVPPGKKIV